MILRHVVHCLLKSIHAHSGTCMITPPLFAASPFLSHFSSYICFLGPHLKQFAHGSLSQNLLVRKPKRRNNHQGGPCTLFSFFLSLILDLGVYVLVCYLGIRCIMTGVGLLVYPSSIYWMFCPIENFSTLSQPLLESPESILSIFMSRCSLHLAPTYK